jgi:hypothetical protein
MTAVGRALFQRTSPPLTCETASDRGRPQVILIDYTGKLGQEQRAHDLKCRLS